MSDFDPIRLAKLLEMAGHPASNEGEALNSLRAARSILARGGRSLGELALAAPARPPPDSGAQAELKRLRAEVATLTAELDALRSQNARLTRDNARIGSLTAELQVLREMGAQDVPPDPGDPAAPAPATRITEDLIAVFDLLSDWRSVPDLLEKLGADMGPARVRRIIRLLDEKGLLRSVESWPTRYRLRFEGELGEDAKAFRSRIEDALAARASAKAS